MLLPVVPHRLIVAEGAARGRQLKVNINLTEPNNKLDADIGIVNGDKRDSRIQFGQKKKKRRYQQ